jgi:hypothetical protein
MTAKNVAVVGEEVGVPIKIATTENFFLFTIKQRLRGHVTVTAESLRETASVAVCAKDA